MYLYNKGEIKMIRFALQVVGGLAVAAIGAALVYGAKNNVPEDLKELKQATEFFKTVEFKIKPQRKVEEEEC